MILLALGVAWAEPTLRDLFGINEAVSIPTALVDRLDDAGRLRFIEARIALVHDLGVRHVRVHSANYPYLSWQAQRTSGARDEVDLVVRAMRDADLEPLLMIGPWPGNGPARVTASYLPQDMAAYLDWVQATVERYDGDGVDDVPQLHGGVHAWEIDNEPALHSRVPPRGDATSWAPGFEAPAEYAKLATLTRARILRSDPDALVLPAGLLHPAGPAQPYATALWTLPFRQHFICANLHVYPNQVDAVWSQADVLLQLSEAPCLFITEVSTSIRARSEYAQAKDLITLFFEAVRRGTAQVYWHSLMEPPVRRRALSGGRHLYVRPAPGLPARPRLAAQALSTLLERWGDLPRAAWSNVATEDGNAMRLGADLVAWGDHVTLTLSEARVLVPLVGETPIHTLLEPGTHRLDLRSLGPVRLSPTTPPSSLR